MFSKRATGDIYPCRFTTIVGQPDGYAAQAVAGSQIWGVSQKGTRWVPWGPLDDGKAAVQGESLLIYGPGELAGFDVLVQSAAAIAIGQKLKSDINGKATPVTAAGDEYGAIALRAVSGADQLVLVQIVSPSQTYTGA